MSRIKQSEILWIVRGIRLGRMLKRCAGAARRQLERFHRQVGMDTADESLLRTSGRRMPSADTGADLTFRFGWEPSEKSASWKKIPPQKRNPP